MRRGADHARLHPMQTLVDQRELPFVVVGVDGSDGSRDALRFAAREAVLRDARLRIVTAWSVPLMAFAAGFTAGIGPGACASDAELLSREAVREAREISPHLAIEAIVAEAEPASALLAAAVGADMLVLGPEGYGRIARVVLGMRSIDDAVAHGARCPVTIVHVGAAPSGV
jgi:nucleotide-binding universal stress UspA family protein